MNDDISKYLGTKPMILDAEIVSDTPRQVAAASRMEIKTEDTPEHERDFKYARQNFIDIIEKGSRALEELMDVAVQSQHPRAYEVLATTMKTLIDANKDLVEMSRKNNPEPEAKPTGKVTNNLFVGSTNDLQKILRDMNNE
jgi:hypothetical protein|tara:strand:- start:1078 stop:1500 length:423 start_codon:yes stop_codon:yes gene_type:complete